jgi:hypothetical protein
VGPNSQNTFDKFIPSYIDIDGNNPVSLKIESLPTVGKFESDIDGDGIWTTITNSDLPLIISMSDLSKYRFNAGDNSGLVSNVDWSIVTDGNTTLWSNTATGVVTIIDPSQNNAPDVNLSVSGVVSIDEDSKTEPIYITFSDDYTPEAFLVGIVDSNDSSKVSLSDGDFNITRISDNNVSVVITPKSNIYGDVTITLGAYDGDKNGTKSFTLRVNSINDAPSAFNFEKTISPNQNYYFSNLDPTTVYVDTNDSSQDKNELYPDIFQIVTLPQHGILHLGDNSALFSDTNVSINDLSTLVYTPENDNQNDVNFTWRAYDGQYWTELKTATININELVAENEKPTISTIDNFNISQSSSESTNSITFDISDDDSISSITAVSSDEDLVTVSVVDNEDGTATLTYNVLANASGRSNIIVTVIDSDGEKVTSNFYITIKLEESAICVDDTQKALVFDIIKGENSSQSNIKSDLNFVNSFDSVCSDMNITWSVSDTSVIENNGTVHTSASDTQTVAAKANISKGEFSVVKSFLLTVLGGGITDENAIGKVTLEDIKGKNSRRDEIISD